MLFEIDKSINTGNKMNVYKVEESIGIL